MIKIESYSKKFEDVYWETVDGKISHCVQKCIMNSCEQYLPPDFWGNVPVFKDLVLAPFEKLKMAQKYINQVSNRKKMELECFRQETTGDKKSLKYPYDIIYNAYRDVAKSVKDGMSMRVRIVRNAGVTVCPYCNRDYINSRAKKVSGAELDHFFSRSKYPLFSLSLYNLVPVCGNCNRIKSNRKVEFASPFDDTIEWEKDVTFSYLPKNSKPIKITINKSNRAIKNNIEKMKIREAYQIHAIEIEELLEKQEIYSKTQRQEFVDVLSDINVTEREIKQAIFGPKITEENMGTKPLGKMLSDLHKELGIY